jgi:transcriptional regulator with XRE-family HTH domain
MDLPCHLQVGKQQDETKQPRRKVVAKAFGKALRKARGPLTLGQIEIRTGASQSALSLLEDGKVYSPDPVLLAKLADLYGVSFLGLIALLDWSRKHPLAEDAPAPLPLGDHGMRVLGLEEEFVRRLRSLNAEDSRQLLQFMNYLQGEKRGDAATWATFRKGKGSAR